MNSEVAVMALNLTEPMRIFSQTAVQGDFAIWLAASFLVCGC